MTPPRIEPMEAVRSGPSHARTSRDVIWAGYLRGIARGDAEALGCLYDESSAFVYGLALRMLGDPTEAEEIALDVYTKVWRSAMSFDPRRGSAPVFLAMLARSRAIDRRRSLGSRRRTESPIADGTEWLSPSAGPEELTLWGERERKVREALRALPARERQAIELAFFSGLSHTEVADRLAEPLGTVKSRIRSGLSKLRRLLED